LAIQCNLTRVWRCTLEVSRTSNSCSGAPHGSSKTTIHTEPALSISPTIGGLLEWDMWARIDRNRLPRPLKYAPFRLQIRLSRVAIGPPPRHQQTTAIAGCDSIDPPRFSAHAPFSLRTFPSLDHLWCIEPTSLKAAVGARSSSPANIQFAPEVT
jgi:hypothetical protein